MSYVAVIDVETTGLWPQRYHRIVELAAIVMRPDGEIIREFVTLINPERDLGPTHIHGLSACDVTDAPRFREIAAELLETLDGCVAIAGHNVRFDQAFLLAEFERLDIGIPHAPGLCTMHLAGGGSLGSVCHDYGIQLPGDAHSAHHDAAATAELLSRLLRSRQGLMEEISRWSPIPWPMVPRSDAKLVTRCLVRTAQAGAPSYIERLMSRLPTASSSDAADDEASLAYLDLLSRVLEDRRVDPSEGEALFELASDWGMTPDRIVKANRNYLESLAAVALSDGVLSDSEHRDLCRVAALLGIRTEDAEGFLQQAKLKATGSPLVTKPSSRKLVEVPSPDLVGKSVCFTGECQCCIGGELITRGIANHLASQHGLMPAKGVTKKLDLLVVADGFTESSKARKAREYGIRIMHESVFWKTIGVEVE